MNDHQNEERFERALPQLLGRAGWRDQPETVCPVPAEEVDLFNQALEEPMEQPAIAPVRPTRPPIFAWGGAVAAVLVLGVSVGVYQVREGQSPAIQAVVPSDLELYGANLGTALESVAALPETGQAELEATLALGSGATRLQSPVRVVRSTDPRIANAGLKAVDELAEAGMVPWQGNESLTVRFRLTFDGRRQTVQAAPQR